MNQIAGGGFVGFYFAGGEMVVPRELENGRGSVQILIDKGVAEIFVDGGARYIVREIPATTAGHGLELGFGKTGSAVNRLEIYQMKSMWDRP